MMDSPEIESSPTLYPPSSIADEGSDVTFIVGQGNDQQWFPAHKEVLCIRSPVFNEMLSNEFAEKNEIFITDLTPQGFHEMLKYIYLGSIEFPNVDVAVDTLWCAKLYNIPVLQRLCTEYICSHTDVNIDNVCKQLEFSRSKGLDSVLFRCAVIIDKEIEYIMNSNDFYSARPETIEFIIKRSTLNLGSEYQLFYAVTQWASCECQRRNLNCTKENFRVILKNIITHIRFLTMTHNELKEVSKHRVVKRKLLRLLLRQIAKPSSQIPSELKYLCTAKDKRKYSKDEKFFVCLHRQSYSFSCHSTSSSEGTVNFNLSLDVNSGELFLIGIRFYVNFQFTEELYVVLVKSDFPIDANVARENDVVYVKPVFPIYLKERESLDIMLSFLDADGLSEFVISEQICYGENVVFSVKPQEIKACLPASSITILYK